MNGLKAASAAFVDWVQIAAGGDALFACDGSIYRHRRWREAVGARLLTDADRLIDLTSASFELIRPPREALRW